MQVDYVRPIYQEKPFVLMKRFFIISLVFAMLFAAGCTHGPEVIVDIGDPGETGSPALTTDDPAVTFAPTDAPTDAPTPDPDLTPEPTKVPDQLPPGQVLWLNVCPTDMYGVSTADAEAWFSDAVFIGDSIVLGWKNYNNHKLESDPNFFGQTHFLCEGSYGTGHALEPISANSLHPLYQGQQHYLWDSVQMMGAKKVIICFGVNDLAIYGIDGTAQNYETVVDKIVAQSPDAEICIISAMYLIDDSKMKALTNENLRTLNGKLKEMCERKGYDYLDIASHLVGPDGYLKPEYCSDNFVHQTYAAYDVWSVILRSYAAHHIKYGY